MCFNYSNCIFTFSLFFLHFPISIPVSFFFVSSGCFQRWTAVSDVTYKDLENTQTRQSYQLLCPPSSLVPSPADGAGQPTRRTEPVRRIRRPRLLSWVDSDVKHMTYGRGESLSSLSTSCLSSHPSLSPSSSSNRTHSAYFPSYRTSLFVRSHLQSKRPPELPHKSTSRLKRLMCLCASAVRMYVYVSVHPRIHFMHS